MSGGLKLDTTATICPFSLGVSAAILPFLNAGAWHRNADFPAFDNPVGGLAVSVKSILG
jgi:hypothetical protein